MRSSADAIDAVEEQESTITESKEPTHSDKFFDVEDGRIDGAAATGGDVDANNDDIANRHAGQGRKTFMGKPVPAIDTSRIKGSESTSIKRPGPSGLRFDDVFQSHATKRKLAPDNFDFDEKRLKASIPFIKESPTQLDAERHTIAGSRTKCYGTDGPFDSTR